jgi:hypothetical protein
MIASYTESYPHAIPFEGFSARSDASVLLCLTFSLMPALLPMGDEFTMKFEAVSVSFSTIL